MDAEKIIQDLNRRFAAPLPEFYKRRIVVWIDEDQEFVDKLDEITLGGAKIIALTGTNNFYVKKLLAVDDPTSNYLVYRPFAYESDEGNWLLDIELYGEEFRADLVSMWMDEMGIPQTPALRRGFKQYRKFFNAQARRNKVSAQPVTPTTPAQLQMAIMAALAGLKDAKPNAIIKAVLQAGLLKDSNAVYQEFVNYGIDEAFWRMVAQGTGYQDMDSDLAQLATHILLTASTRTMRQEFLSGLQMFISSAHQAYCYAGHHYNCVEQYMMYQKVLMFRQYDLAEKILASNNPSEIKRLGRTRFPEFNSDVWDRTSYANIDFKLSCS